MDELFCPISSLPKALIDKSGLPYKSANSATTPYLEKRYKSAPVLIASLPWVPTSVIMEGMFMIQTEPFPTIENMKEYVKMLFLKYVRPHFLDHICKQNLTEYAAGAMLKIAPTFMSMDQEFITNVKEMAFSTNNNSECMPRPTFYVYSNADESDNRVWLHCVHSHGTLKLIYSPDTDIYHIGLAIIQSMPATHVLVHE